MADRWTRLNTPPVWAAAARAALRLRNVALASAPGTEAAIAREDTASEGPIAVVGLDPASRAIEVAGRLAEELPQTVAVLLRVRDLRRR